MRNLSNQVEESIKICNEVSLAVDSMQLSTYLSVCLKVCQ